VQEVLDPDDTAKRCDLLITVGEALGPAGEPRRAAEEVLEAAFTAAEQLGDGGRASRACRAAVDALWSYGGLIILRTGLYWGWTERADRHAAAGSLDRVYADLARAIRRQGTDCPTAEVERLYQGALALAR